jgi:hypothetical protein
VLQNGITNRGETSNNVNTQFHIFNARSSSAREDGEGEEKNKGRPVENGEPPC